MPIALRSSRILSAVALYLAAASTPVCAATYTVTSAADTTSAGTLRWAITQANNNLGSDTINFAIASGVQTILLTSALPAVAGEGVLIDGTTQPGYANVPLIQLSGQNAADGINGLVLTNGSSTVRALSIINFKDSGVVINGNGHVIHRCRIGVDSAGAVAGNSDNGIYAVGWANQILLNVISANGKDGLRIDTSGSSETLVYNNFIGTNAAGTAALPNGLNGVVLNGARNNRIGGVGLGNIISGNTRNGIGISGGASGNVMIRNYLGVAADGATDLGNGWNGVLIVDSPGNSIGGTASGEYNVISGNQLSGVEVRGAASDGNTVRRGFIGTDVNGTLSRGNGAHGVLINGAVGTVVGGVWGEGGNLISSNTGNGVEVTGSDALLNVIRGNRIGTDASGALARGNANGVLVSEGANFTKIGLAEAGAGNLISGNLQAGIGLYGQNVAAFNTDIQGNLVGTNATGGPGAGNALSGVYISGRVQGAYIGGDTPAARNIISGNLSNGISIHGPNASSNSIQGNWIGLAADGSALGNLNYGVYSSEAGTSIGDANANSGNVISANRSGGLHLRGASHGLINNIIGMDPTGTIARGNLGSGVTMVSATNSSVGSAWEGNLISANTGNGVYFIGASQNIGVRNNLIGLDINGGAGFGNGGDGVAVFQGVGIGIMGNRIAGNADLGIDLGGDGATGIDPGDGDEGPNHLQNAPQLNAAFVSGGSTLLAGTISTVANGNYRVEFFANVSCDASGFGEGVTYVGGVEFTTNASGNASYTMNVTGWPLGTVFTATATSNPNGGERNSSEFSSCLASQAAPSAPVASNNGPICQLQTLQLSATAISGASYRWTGPNGFTSTLQSPTITNAALAAAGGYTVVATVSGVDLAPSTTTAQVRACTIALNDLTIDEGHVPAVTAFQFTVTMSHTSSQAVSVNYATGGGDAETLYDYATTSGTVTFAPGEQSKFVTVNVKGEAWYEADEDFFVNLTSPSAGSIADAQGRGVITNDDPLPTVTLSAVLPCLEANAGVNGNSSCSMKVTLSNPSEFDVGGNVAITPGSTHPVTMNADLFAHNGGTWRIGGGYGETPIYAAFPGDAIHEWNETFVVTLSGVYGAAPTGNTLAVTREIVDDDPPPDFTVEPCVVAEGHVGTTPCAFVVSFNANTERQVDLQVWTDVSDNLLAASGDASVENPPMGTVSQSYTAGQTFGQWRVEAGNIDHKTRAQCQASHLRQSVDLHGDAPGTIAHDVATVPGQRYLVSFALSGHPGCALRTTSFVAEFDSQFLGSYSFNSTGYTTANMGWRYEAREVIATEAVSTLRFTSTTPGTCGPALDDFSVTPIAAGAANSGIDFVPTYAPYDVPLQVAAGAAPVSVIVPIIGDTADEADEDLQLKVCTVDGGNCHTGLATIIDDDAPLPNLIMKNGFE